MSRYIAVVPAAGSGSRMGAATPKQYLPLLGRPLLHHTLEALAAVSYIDQVLLVISPADEWFTAEGLSPACRAKLVVKRCGGASRAESVCNGLRSLRDEAAPNDWILVHDAARPCLEQADVARLIETLRDDAVGGILAVPVADTLKRADAGDRITATVPREQLWRAQTPQMFRHGELLRALETTASATITDEASAIEAAGMSPRLVRGSERNIKVTYPEDIALAEIYLTTGRSSQA